MATSMRATINIARGMDGAITEILLGAVKGQNLAAERLLALSADEAPLDSNGGGTLIASGTVVPAAAVGDDSLVTYDTPYAARWHEDQELVDNLGRHYTGDSNFQNGRKSHYLVDPARENKAELIAIVAAGVKRG